MEDVLFAVIFMGIVFAFAAGILVVIDKFTLRKSLAKEEKATAVAQRTARWQRRWRIFFVVMAAISLPLNWIGLLRRTEPLFPTIIWIALATLVLLGALGWVRRDDERGDGTE